MTPERQIGRGTRYWADDVGIVHGEEVNDTPFRLSDAEEALRLIREIGGGQKSCLLMDISRLKSMSREARTYFSAPDRTEDLLAVALIINSPLSRVIGNFFLGLNKAAIPVRLFTEEKQAVDWLRPFAKEPGRA